MKTLILLTLLAAPTLVLAQSQPSNQNQEMFTKMKTEAVQNMDQRIANLQKARDCVQSANSQDQLRACRQAHREAMSGIRESMQERRQQMQQMREEMRKNRGKQRGA